MSELVYALRDLKEAEVYRLVDDRIDRNVSPIKTIEECNRGMVAVGELFSANRYFIAELIFAAEILKTVMKKMEPLLEKNNRLASRGKVVIGTVRRDRLWLQSGTWGYRSFTAMRSEPSGNPPSLPILSTTREGLY